MGRGSTLKGFEELYHDCCTIKVLYSVTQPISSYIQYRDHISNASCSNVRDQCPTISTKFERCPPATLREIHTQITILNLYAEGVKLLTGVPLAIVTLAGKGSRVAEILKELNPDYSDVCTSTTHAQNLAVRINGFSANVQRKYVTNVVEDISNHLRSRHKQEEKAHAHPL